MHVLSLHMAWILVVVVGCGRGHVVREYDAQRYNLHTTAHY